MSAMQNFVFEDTPVRVVEIDGEPWFAGVDLCRALGIRNPNQALAGLDPDERRSHPLATAGQGRGGTQDSVLVSEPGMYQLVFSSRRPEAKRFRRWIVHDMLGQIRRTGGYARPVVRHQGGDDPAAFMDAFGSAEPQSGPDSGTDGGTHRATPVIITVPFHGDTLFAADIDGTIYVVLKPICESLGIAWQPQHARLTSDPVLREGITTIDIPSVGGVQNSACLRLNLLNGWLFKIDSRRVKSPQAREKLIAYQRECYELLADHFLGRRGASAAPEPDQTGAEDLPPQPVPHEVSFAECRQALALVRECRLLLGPAQARRLWDILPGLPKVPAPRTEQDLTIANACLEHLLQWQDSDRLSGNQRIRDILDEATRGSTTAERRLRDIGIRLVSDDQHGDGIAVASSLPSIFTIYEHTPWPRGRHRMALRALPGAMPWKAMKFTGTHASMGTFIPMVLIIGE